jgi:hypothetical protein
MVNYLFEGLEQRTTLICSSLSVVALLLYGFSILQAQTPSYSSLAQLGLFSILPISYFAAFGILVLTFFITIFYVKRAKFPLLISQTLLLIIFLNATPSIIETTARFTTAYTNFIPVDYITKTGHIDPAQNWVLNWPGFSVLISIITQLTAIPGNIILVVYPTVVNILLFAPLYAFFRALHLETKTVWIAVWFVYFGNWVGQDYFSMQSLAFLVIIVIFFILFKNMNNELRTREWFLIFFILFFYLITSHLLSPLIIVIAVFALYLTRQLPRFSLLLGLIVIIVAWTVFDAGTYLSANLSLYLQQAVNIIQTVSANVGNRVSTGSVSHIAVADVRILYTVVLISFAAIGILVAWRHKFSRVEKRLLIILASFVLPLVAFSYGGEMFMRIFMFSLLPLAYFAVKATMKYKKLLVVFIAFLMLFAPALTIIAHYGNEPQDYVPPSEVAGINFFYSTTSQGLVVGGGTRSGNFRDLSYRQNYTTVNYYDLMASNSSDLIWKSSTSLKITRGYIGENQYVCISYGSESYFRFFYGQPQFIGNIEGNITQSTLYDRLYSNPSLTTYYLNSPFS